MAFRMPSRKPADQKAVNFVNEWIAGEYGKAPSGETEAEIKARFVADGRAWGVAEEGLEEGLCDPDWHLIVAHHRKP